MSIKRAII